ncbi:MAG: tRNA (adenosine(37)-N6)-threonylcarbamoyltransferase complex transferase subunit TsaD [Candidatus Moraniibacteriota bacterium]
MIILGIETSCDETALAIIEKDQEKISVLANIVSSQIKLHAPFGGVVPNLAAREHLKNILPVLKTALKQARKKPSDIDLISVTHGPGLIPALLIGVQFAKTLSYVWEKPLLGVHHIEGHIFANFLEKSNLKFPAIALVVSGGHTQIVLIKKMFDYQIIGETLDDAVGEAFDKVARMLGLNYPGGPEISRLAEEFKQNKSVSKINLPRPMIDSSDSNFSFSGLKTAVLYLIKNFRRDHHLETEDKLPESLVKEVAYEFQESATDVLIKKTLQAAQRYQAQTVFLAGGVSANQTLRDKLKCQIEKKLPHTEFILQPIEYSTDNATMIAIAGAYRWENLSPEEKLETKENWKDLQAQAQIKLS